MVVQHVGMDACKVVQCGVLVGLGDLLSEVGSVGIQSLVGIVHNLPE